MRSSITRGILASLGLLFTVQAMAQQVVTVRDADIPPGANVTWTADKVYVLEGIVFVDPGATLTIEPGTVIKGATGQGNNASGLVVTRDAKIFAEGTPDRPIIFTSIEDDPVGSLTYQDRGLWGGVVILGRASTNNPTEGGEKQVEGVNELVGPGDDRATYGGNDDDHSSGVFRYVSIRHSGINVGDQAGNEIQGLTLGGVGRGTVIEYVESFASADDGFEWFGGTVNTKYLVSAFNADDSFDWDEGFRGKGQYWFAIQATDGAGAAAEMDGALGNEFHEPYAIPQVWNATYIGPGVEALPEGDRAEMLIFRDNSGGKYFNSIFTEFNAAEGGLAITIERVEGDAAKPVDSEDRLAQGDLVLQGNIWYGFGAGNELSQFAPQPWANAYLADPSNGNRVASPMLRGIDREGMGGLDPRPQKNSPAWTTNYSPEDAFFDRVPWVGAFGLANWLEKWTALDQLGFVGLVPTSRELTTSGLPARFELDQNYPNPFNPATTIQYALPEAQNVRLVVFDMLGREMARLVDGLQSAGTYTVSFDAAHLPSGLYLYRLEGNNTVETRKMLLLK